MPHLVTSRSIVVSSVQAGGGKTHVACALARWLANQGVRVAPLHLSGAGAERIEQPGGYAVSRETALLAEACRLAPEPLHESSWRRLAELERLADAIVVEAGWEEALHSALPVVAVERRGGQLRVNGFPVPAFDPPVTCAPAPELEGLPEWTYLSRPRVGVVSVPHLLEFRDLALLRGAEWLSSAGVGQFEFLILPASADPERDAAWLKETGLEEWLRQQSAGGAVVASCGWEAAGARRIAREDLTDYRRLSLLLGRRLPAPLPGDETFERMADWIAPWAEQETLLARFL